MLDQAIERFGWAPPRQGDLEALREQIGREPKAVLAVARRCHYGKPLVVVNDPVPPAGEGVDLFPTLFWLTCPYLAQKTGALEAEGWIGRLRERQSQERGWAEHMARVHRRQAELRLSLADPGRLARLRAEAPGKYEVVASSGVGGARYLSGVKCLHAHLADYLARTTPQTVSDPGEPVNLVGRESARMLLERGVDLMGSPSCAACRRASLSEAKVAAVDIGSNSVRLWVGEMRRPPKEVCRGLVTTRLGAGAARGGRLEPGAMDATVEALKRFAAKARQVGAAAAAGAATQAVRSAANGGELLVRVWEEAGLSVPAVSGDEEAELSYAGVLRALPEGLEVEEGRLLVIDVGGGSTELVAGDFRGDIADRTSVPLGAVSLTGRFLEGERVAPGALEALVAHVREEASGLGERFAAGGGPVVATGGTATSLAAVAQELAAYDPEKVHGYLLDLGELKGLLSRLAGLPLAERKALPGLDPRRAEIIVAGAAILAVLLETVGAPRCVVSEADLLHGLAWRLAGAPARTGVLEDGGAQKGASSPREVRG